MAAFSKPRRKVSRVFVHCSASDRKSHDNLATIRRWHVKGRGWSDVGYHYVITQDGKVHEGRPLRRIPAAQRGHNTGSLAICCTGHRRFTARQMRSLIDLCMEIHEAYGARVTFHGHREVANKACPVFGYRSVLALDSNGRMQL